jgi:succinoglycan biosynthesis transport protein ExoP
MMEQSQIQERVTNAIPTEDIQIAQRAHLPTRPISPRPVFNAIVSLFVGLTLGTGVAYFVEYLDTSTKSVDEIERYLDLPIFAVIPRQKTGLLIHESPKSHVAENYRMLWTNILFARKQHQFNKMMITSGGAGEGKTTTVVNLGIAAAQMGTKILLVDSDLRRPKIHKLLKYSNKVGLSDVLLKDVEPREVIVATEVENLWAMPSGRLPKNVIGLLNSQKMREIITRMEQDYDVILFDSPPVMGVSDASVMADLMDRILLVVDYKNPKRLARNAKRHLENAGGTLIGAVINNLNIQRGDYYYYGYYGYGYGKGYHYYYSSRHDEEEESEEKESVAGATAAAGATDAASNADSQQTV